MMVLNVVKKAAVATRWTLTYVALSATLTAQINVDCSPTHVATTTSAEISRLQGCLSLQEQALKRLEQAMEEQHLSLQALLGGSAQVAGPAQDAMPSPATDRSRGTVSAALPTAKRVPVAGSLPTKTDSRQSQLPAALSINIGSTTFTPLGFVDATLYGHSTNVGSGIGTSFGAIPYNTSYQGHTSETNLSTQNSRVGFRVDSKVKGATVLGYFEADFLGNQASSIYVTSNADTFRMRNVFVDIQKNRFEILAGQDWSLFTPNRTGLSPLPSDIFYTQNVDTNYQVGLPWARQSQLRFVFHASKSWTLGTSLENPQQFVGNNVITYPTAFASYLNGTTAQFNNTTTNYTTPNLHPDVIVKSAYDFPGVDHKAHLEAGVLIRSFKDTFPFGSAPVEYRSQIATGVSGEVNANAEIRKGVRLFANTFFGSGGGRYLFGLGPDTIIRADGSLSPIHAYGTVEGFEIAVRKNTFNAYYGGAYFAKNVSVDTDGKTLIGYGFHGSAPSNNRAIQEATVGMTHILWKDLHYGVLSIIPQVSYVWRDPWSAYGQSGASLGPKDARTFLYYLDLRYTLP